MHANRVGSENRHQQDDPQRQTRPRNKGPGTNSTSNVADGMRAKAQRYWTSMAATCREAAYTTMLMGVGVIIGVAVTKHQDLPVIKETRIQTYDCLEQLARTVKPTTNWKGEKNSEPQAKKQKPMVR